MRKEYEVVREGCLVGGLARVVCFRNALLRVSGGLGGSIMVSGRI